MLHGFYGWMTAQMSELNDEEGATAVEYGLMVALIAAIIVGVVALLGPEIKTAFPSPRSTTRAGTPPTDTNLASFIATEVSDIVDN